MIFPVAQCIEVLSQGMTLLPGDIIATGTPEGVGAASGNFLKAGDRIEAEVEQHRRPRTARSSARSFWPRRRLAALLLDLPWKARAAL